MKVRLGGLFLAARILAAPTCDAQTPPPPVPDQATAPAVATDSSAVPTPPAAAAASTGFSGAWVLNVAKSEDAREKMREARSGRSGGGGRGMGGHGGWGGHGGMGGMGGRGGWGGRGGQGGEGGQPGSEGSRGDAGESMHRFMEPPQQMTVTHTGNEITVVEKDGILRVLHVDGEKHKTDNGDSQIKSRWDKQRLIVETTPDRGPKITETWTLAEGPQLLIDVKLDSAFAGTVKVRRVYEPQKLD